eukprot:Nitzschia sp. Nitz4//scaffold55_size114948//6166//7777//NITZ4_003880-RA/size114948-exonerate_est2genome-gene-0.139-mRNA-1//-1//CDS//3329554467//7765//frame0
MVDTNWLIAILPKIGATLSIPSSLFIIFESIEDHRHGKGTAIQRALVGMSFVDVCASSAWWSSTWLLPRDSGMPMAVGNQATCNFQGFLLQLAIGAPLYNCSLALYYLLVIRYNWTNQQLAKIEIYVHASIIIFSVGTSIVGLPLTMYNQVTSVCWVIGSPPDCGHSSTITSDEECDRGDWAWIFGVALFYGPLWVCVLLTVIAMCVIYFHVRATFQRSEQWTQRNTDASAIDLDSRSTVPRLPSNTPFSGLRSNSSFSFRPAVRSEAWCASQLEPIEGSTESQPESECGDGGNPLNHSEPLEERGTLSTLKTRMQTNGAGSALETIDASEELEITPDESSSELLAEELPESDFQNGNGARSVNCNRNFTESDISQRNGVSTVSNGANEAEDEWRTNTVTPPPPRASTTRRRPSSSSNHRRRQTQFAVQAILYSASFFVTWTPSTIWSVAYWFGAGGPGFDIAASSCEPLQGFWNMLIFIRSRSSSRAKLSRVFGCFAHFWEKVFPNWVE